MTASLQEAARTQSSLLRALLDSTELDENGFYRDLADKFHLRWGGSEVAKATPEMRAKLPARIALRYQLLPIETNDESITLLTYDPFDLLARQAVAEAVPQQVRYEIYTRKGILPALRQVYGIGAETFEELLEGRGMEEDIDLGRGEQVNVLDEDESEEASVKNSFTKSCARPCASAPPTSTSNRSPMTSVSATASTASCRKFRSRPRCANSSVR